jgi:hypothetical protein
MTDTPKNPPPDWALDMAQLRYDPMEDRAAFNIATSGPTSAIPKDHRQSAPAAPVSTSGNVRPLSPPPGIALIDRLVAQTEAQERAKAQQPDFTQMMMVMTKQMEMQSQMLTALVALVARMEDKK